MLHQNLCIDITNLAVVRTFTAEPERGGLSIYFRYVVNTDVETLKYSPETFTSKQIIGFANIRMSKKYLNEGEGQSTFNLFDLRPQFS